MLYENHRYELYEITNEENAQPLNNSEKYVHGCEDRCNTVGATEHRLGHEKL